MIVSKIPFDETLHTRFEMLRGHVVDISTGHVWFAYARYSVTSLTITMWSTPSPSPHVVVRSNLRITSYRNQYHASCLADTQPSQHGR